MQAQYHKAQKHEAAIAYLPAAAWCSKMQDLHNADQQFALRVE